MKIRKLIYALLGNIRKEIAEGWGQLRNIFSSFKIMINLHFQMVENNREKDNALDFRPKQLLFF